ncbi:hypothetical protein AMS68_003187 [Peltaster fructicola]|uniref:UmuC domain-containing protein n=1 Tax=Peltaster fructicola TaxID=286661 RepID=A0A6H0XT84_9PEZI|nr:hypothetical protein AMS68_003187 [Peltaster fructicola]
MQARPVPARKDGRLIIHFDYDCFYASVFEAKNPGLRSLPFAVQQKQIIVTCNYEARRRGLYKLMLIKDARRVCPEVIIELGEDISRFRDASKELYKFIESYTWNGRVEKLGFDEVWMDVTDMVEYNLEVLNRNDLVNSFFQMSRDDPEEGFPFDATCVAGHTYPNDYTPPHGELDELTLRLRLASHLAMHMRHQLDELKGYTSTVGISTSKLISKLVGNLNKPNGQTTLMPPLLDGDAATNNAIRFMDDHEIGKVPGIGFKLSQQLRAHVLKHAPDFDKGLVYGGTLEHVKVADVRNDPDVNPEMLEKLLTGPGSAHGIGYKIWSLLHGVDDTEVSHMRQVPRQISIEDSYIRLDTMSEVTKELTALANSLLTRMRIDLLGPGDDGLDGDDTSDPEAVSTLPKKWLAHPKTLRLTTRPRQPLQADGTRQRSFKRISHSAPLPTFVFRLSETVELHAEQLVQGTLLGMFRKLHPEKSGWNLSLVNLAVTNMAETAGDSKTANGRDIGNMFKRQDDVLKDFRITELDDSFAQEVKPVLAEDNWDSDGGDDEEMKKSCDICGMYLPSFAVAAHRRFHTMDNVSA